MNHYQRSGSHRLIHKQRALTHKHSDSGLRVHVTSDGSDVYADSFLRDALDSNGSFRPTLLLLGLRLGIDRVTPIYWDALKATLQMEQSVGVAGSVHCICGICDRSFGLTTPYLVAGLRRRITSSGCRAITFSTLTRTKAGLHCR
jgi:hypothetical protein